jgi:hypothetical protein
MGALDYSGRPLIQVRHIFVPIRFLRQTSELGGAGNDNVLPSTKIRNLIFVVE